MFCAFTDSHSESEHEHPEDDQERTPEYKRRSKFEDESEKESETESVHHSNEENDGDYLEETPPESPVELKPQLPPYFPAIQGCRPVDEFQCLNRIEEGTYGVVYRAVDKKTGRIWHMLCKSDINVFEQCQNLFCSTRDTHSLC